MERFFEVFLPVWANAEWTEKPKTNSIMKAKLPLRIPTALLILIASITAVPAQLGPKDAPAVNSATGFPIPTTIDPSTGLPTAKPQWISPNWKGPAKVLPRVRLEGLPVSEVARYLLQEFSNDFDVVIPNANIPNYTGNPVKSIGDYPINLWLRNVTASELFRAMNLEFEAENTPVRWELTMNGNRPTAVIRVVPALLPPAPKPPPLERKVIFVGDLLGNEKSGGMTMDQIIHTISQVWSDAYGKPGKIQFYDPAQLLIVTGTPDQIDFVRQTIEALKQKVELARPKSAENKEIENN